MCINLIKNASNLAERERVCVCVHACVASPSHLDLLALVLEKKLSYTRYFVNHSYQKIPTGHLDNIPWQAAFCCVCEELFRKMYCVFCLLQL